MAVTTQWRGQKDTQRWRFYSLLGLSFVLHSVLTPWAALLGLLGLLGLVDPVETEALPPITSIPIDLFEEDLNEATAEPPQAEPEPSPDPPEAPSDPEPGGEAFVEPEPETNDPKPGEPEAEATEERENIADPVSLSGTAGKVADENANVRLIVDTEKVRQHSLGTRVGALLAKVPQWRDFFGPANIDAIEDIDRIFIAGPQLRDSSEVVAVLKYNLPQATVEAAVDQLVKRSGGEWIDGPVKAATARADRAERVFAFIAPELVAVVPESAKKATLKPMKGKLSLPPIPGDVVLTVHVATPYRVFLGLPFRFPTSIKSIKASVTPTADGGARVVLLGIDESKESAEVNARLIEAQVRAAATPRGLQAMAAKALFGAPDRYIETVEFRAEDDKIHGTLTMTATQLDGILNLAQGIINMYAPPPKPQPSSRVPGAPGSGNAPEPAAPKAPGAPGAAPTAPVAPSSDGKTEPAGRAPAAPGEPPGSAPPLSPPPSP